MHGLKAFDAPTFVVEIFVSGSKDIIELECARYCREVGLCVSIESTRFIYTGGIESGCVVRLLNYPRFPHSNRSDIEDQAISLASRLIDATCQDSALVVGPVTTHWLTRREG